MKRQPKDSPNKQQPAAPRQSSRCPSSSSSSSYILVDIFVDHTATTDTRQVTEVSDWTDCDYNASRLKRVQRKATTEIQFHSDTPFLFIPNDPAQWNRQANSPTFYQSDKATWAALKSQLVGAEHILKVGVTAPVGTTVGYAIFFEAALIKYKLHGVGIRASNPNLARATIILE